MSTPDAPRVLVADDQADVLEALRILLKGEGFEIVTASSPSRVLASVEQTDFDAVLMDLNYTRDTTSGGEGMDLLTQIRSLDSTLPVLVMTAWSSVDGAVEAMRRGARDYVEKPWDNERLLKALSTQVELGRALRRGQHLEDENRLLRGERRAGLHRQIKGHGAGSPPHGGAWGRPTPTSSLPESTEPERKSLRVGSMPYPIGRRTHSSPSTRVASPRVCSRVSCSGT